MSSQSDSVVSRDTTTAQKEIEIEPFAAQFDEITRSKQLQDNNQHPKAGRVKDEEQIANTKTEIEIEPFASQFEEVNMSKHSNSSKQSSEGRKPRAEDTYNKEDSFHSTIDTRSQQLWETAASLQEADLEEYRQEREQRHFLMDQWKREQQHGAHPLDHLAAQVKDAEISKAVSTQIPKLHRHPAAQGPIRLCPPPIPRFKVTSRPESSIASQASSTEFDPDKDMDDLLKFIKNIEGFQDKERFEPSYEDERFFASQTDVEKVLGECKDKEAGAFKTAAQIGDTGKEMKEVLEKQGGSGKAAGGHVAGRKAAGRDGSGGKRDREAGSWEVIEKDEGKGSKA